MDIEKKIWTQVGFEPRPELYPDGRAQVCWGISILVCFDSDVQGQHVIQH